MKKITFLSSNNRFQRLAMYALAGFIILFLGRLLYGFVYPNGSSGSNLDGDSSAGYFESIQNLKRNYASEKFETKSLQLSEPPSSNAAIAQKYEKTAHVNAKTHQFENHEKLLRGEIKTFKAVIQYENNTGKAGNRQLQMVIGIAPEKFDSFYIVIQKIGDVQSLSVSKTDKTNEFRNLNAQKLSLEKVLANLNDLKRQGGNISDFVSLNDKILEIETRLQELGVQLGDFDEENEFCTVRFSLNEGMGARKISIWQRLKVAFEWTAKYYCLLMMGAAFALFCIFLTLLIIDKLKIFKTLLSKMEE